MKRLNRMALDMFGFVVAAGLYGLAVYCFYVKLTCHCPWL